MLAVRRAEAGPKTLSSRGRARDSAKVEGPESDQAVLSYGDCLDLLRATSVGRVAVTSHALPLVLPVNFALDGHRIVFRTDASGTLARACEDAVVAFEIDDIAADGRSGWSVLVVGVARLLGGSEALRAVELDLVSAADNNRSQFVAISLGQVSGRLVPRSQPAPATGGPAD